jgi:hypothetical protein
MILDVFALSVFIGLYCLPFQAQKLCTKCGLAWQAAALEGWRLYHDPNYDGYGADGDVQLVEGNPYRDVWRKTCWGIAEQVALYNLQINF